MRHKSKFQWIVKMNPAPGEEGALDGAVAHNRFDAQDRAIYHTINRRGRSASVVRLVDGERTTTFEVTWSGEKVVYLWPKAGWGPVFKDPEGVRGGLHIEGDGPWEEFPA